jgi:hypothetical protein
MSYHIANVKETHLKYWELHSYHANMIPPWKNPNIIPLWPEPYLHLILCGNVGAGARSTMCHCYCLPDRLCLCEIDDPPRIKEDLRN